MERHKSHIDKIALGLTLGGVVLAVAIAILGRLLDENLSGSAFIVFIAFQIAALVLGIITRSTPLGKTAAITSSVLLLGSLPLIS